MVIGMFKKLTCIGAALLAPLCLFTGCAGESSEQAMAAAVAKAETSMYDVENPDPQLAIDAIYKSIDGAAPQLADDDEITELLGVEPSDFEEYYVYTTDPKEGLNNLFIFKETGDSTELRKALDQYRTNLEREYENYDILGSYSIAKNAMIKEQGGYVIMLMTEDNEAAQKILFEYLPQ